MAEFNFTDDTEEEIARQRMLFAGDPGRLSTDAGALQINDITASDFSEAFSASFARESLVGGWLGLFSPDALAERRGDKQEVNPFEWLKANLSTERLASIDAFVGQGVFDDVKTQYQLRQRLAQLEYEIARNERADKDVFGAILGGITGAVADPTTFVPLVGWAAKGRIALGAIRGASKLYVAGRRGRKVAQRVARARDAAKATHEANIAAAKMLGVSTLTHGSRSGAIAGYATTSGIIEGLREVGLHEQQITRTVVESLMNIGFAGLIGGGIGAFARVRNPASPLNPSSPDTIVHHLADDTVNEGAMTRIAGEAPEGIPATAEVPTVRSVDDIRQEVIDTLNEGKGSNLSAAAVEDTTSGFELASGLFNRVPGVAGFNKFLRTNAGTGTPMGRFIHNVSKPARRMYAGLMDRGGTMTQNEIKGLAEGFSAEDIQQILHFQTYHSLQAQQVRMRRGVDTKLGELRAQGKVPDHAPRRISDDAWEGMILRQLITETDENGVPRALFDISADYQKLMRETYGDDFTGLVVNEAKKFAKDTNEIRLDMMQQLKERGLVRDDARVAKLKDEMDAMAARLKELRAEKSKIKAARKKLTKEGDRSSPAGDAKKIAELDLEIDDLKLNRTDVEAARAREKAKVDDLGGEYGTAQMWSTPHILQNQGEFRQFLKRVLNQRPAEDWMEARFAVDEELFVRLGVEDINIEGTPLATRINKTRLSREEGAELREEILDDWNGAGRADRRELLDENVRMYQERMDNAHMELEQLNRDLRMASTGDKVDWETAVSKIGRAEAQLDSLAKQLEDSRRILGNHEKEIGQLDEAFEGIGQNANRPAVGDGGQRAFDFESALRGSDDTDALSSGFSPAKNRQRRARVEAKKNEKIRKVAELEDKVHSMNARLHKAHQMVGDYEEARHALADLGETFESAKRKIARADKDKNKPEVDTVVDNIMNSIAGGDAGRMSSFMEAAETALTTKTPSRLRQRSLRLSLDLRKEAIDKGWLRGDLDALMYTEFRQMSGALGIARGLNLGDRAGQRGTWTDVVKEVSDDYAKLIEKAPNQKAVGKLQRERDLAIKDFGVLRDRLMGNLDPQTDPNKFLQWTAKRMREVNFMAYVPGFLAASLTDVATVHMVNNGIGGLLKNHAADSFNLLRKMGVESNDIAHLAASLEVVQTNHFRVSGRSAAWGNLDDGIVIGDEGLGAAGGALNKATDKFAKGTSNLAGFVNRYSGMPQWNSMWKIMTGLHMTKRIRAVADQGWDNIPIGERSQLAALGMTEDMAKETVELIKKYSPRKTDGTLSTSDIGLDKWAQEGASGAKAAMRYRMVLNRAMNRAIFTPGIGDTPPFMEKWFMKWMFQFQSYAFTFMNRFLNPMSQKLRNIHDVNSATTMAVLLLSANGVIHAKSAITGHDPSELSTENYIYDMLDRSGFFTYLTPYLDGGIKFTTPLLAEVGLNFGGSRSRFSQADWWQTILGVNFRTITDVAKQGVNLTHGDYAKVGKRMLRWAPFNQWMRLMDNVAHDDDEKITNFGFLE